MVNGPKVTLAEVDTNSKGPSLETKQGVVGGLIEPMFTFRSPTGSGMVSGYANEEALYLDLPDAILIRCPDFNRVIKGNLIISAFSDKTGAERALTNEEIKWFRQRILMLRQGKEEAFIVNLVDAY
jgi:hypothetical protein